VEDYSCGGHSSRRPLALRVRSRADGARCRLDRDVSLGPNFALHLAYRTHAWDIERTEQQIVACEHGKVAWQTRGPGAVYLADLPPMVRVASIGVFGGIAEMNLLDIDAHPLAARPAAFPVPAISALGRAVDAVGNNRGRDPHRQLAAPRLRRRLSRQRAAEDVDLLPEISRADPVSVAIPPNAVHLFHDGDSFTVLSELSAPPTASVSRGSRRKIRLRKLSRSRGARWYGGCLSVARGIEHIDSEQYHLTFFPRTYEQKT
jgi:hypothetical protein